MREILVEICEKMGVDTLAVLGRKRDKETAKCRMIVVGIICRQNKYSTTKIGKFLNRHHSTIIYLRNTFENLLSVQDSLLMNALSELE